MQSGPHRCWTLRELALLRKSAREGLSYARTKILLGLEGYNRTAKAVKDTAIRYRIKFRGGKGGQPLKDICPRGHDKLIVGRYRTQCRQCRKERCLERYHANRTAFAAKRNKYRRIKSRTKSLIIQHEAAD